MGLTLALAVLAEIIIVLAEPVYIMIPSVLRNAILAETEFVIQNAGKPNIIVRKIAGNPVRVNALIRDN